MSRRHCGLFCCLFLPVYFGLSVPALAAKPDSVPDWVRSAAGSKLPGYPPETEAVILFDDTTYSVAPDGRATAHVRRATRILRPQGRDAAVVVVPFDGDEKILSLHVWSIGPDGHEYALKDSEISERSFGGGNFYEDQRYKIAFAPGRDPGGVVAVEYEQRIRPYLTETTWRFQDSIPHHQESFTLELPPGYTYGSVWAHHAQTSPVDLEKQRWRWEMTDVPAVELDHVALSPSEQALAGRLTIHYAGPGMPFTTQGSWQSIGEWYDTLAHDRLAPTPELAAKAKELSAGKSDFYDKVEPIAEFVQNQIRYFVIERGIGGQQPHFAGEIFHNHYGDCKDKATVLSAMLSTVGVHSALMMVDHRRGVVDPDAPSIVGDHMIAAIEIPAGYTSPKLRSVVTSQSGRKYLIFDPTWERTPFGQLEANLQGGYGVLMEGAKSQVIQLPVLAPELNTLQRSAVFELQPDGTLHGKVTEHRFGDISESRRNLYTSKDARQQGEFLDHVLGQDFTTFTVSDFKVENVAALNKDLITSFGLTSDHFAKSLGPLLMIRPRVLGSEGLYADRRSRTVPIDLGETVQVKDDFTIELPSGYIVDEFPDSVKLDLGFAAYESSSVLTGNTLRYTRTYTVRQITLPADQYAEVQKLSSVIQADEQSRAVLKKQ